MPEASDQVAVSMTVRPVCGLVMPISEIDGLGPTHWEQVRSILIDALDAAGFDAQIVSSSGTSPVIQKRIVESLYGSDLVVCDVSCKNPNVMLELGMRLAFDKPTIVIKDDQTSYSFDISPIEHLSYPRDLRYHSIVDFRKKLGDAAKKVLSDAKSDEYSGSYLKSFGSFTVAKIESNAVGSDEFIISELKNIRALLEERPRQLAAKNATIGIDPNPKPLKFIVGNLNDDKVSELESALFDTAAINGVHVREIGPRQFEYRVMYAGQTRPSTEEIKRAVSSVGALIIAI